MKGRHILSVRRLRREYAETVALDDVSLDIDPGEFVALLGPSGCGKTTLLRAIGGFIEPTSGDILIDGVSVTKVPPYRRPVNTVFQSYALFPHLTVAQNVAYGPKRAGIAASETARRVGEALDVVGLGPMASRYPLQLSGGQQQRVALARAFVNRPALLLLDEPLGALDLKLRRQMQIELKKIQKQLGITFVFVTHDQEEALVMADRVAVMNNGRIEQVGTGQQIYDTPATEFVADFVGEANLLHVDVADGAIRLRASGSAVGRAPEGARNGAYKLLARPEKLRPAAHACGGIRISGNVARKIFVGDATRVFLELPDRSEITLKLPASDPFAAAMQPGAPLTVELDGSPHLFANQG
jgi:spermidine/putrescine transport system ATP-binding protein